MSRELDALIADKVMGLCVHVLTGDTQETVRTGMTTYKCSKCGQTGFNYQTDREGRVLYPGEYSSSIADAWQVIEKMKELGFYVAVGTGPRGYFADVSIRAGETYTPKSEAHGDNPAECVCNAALRALGLESPDTVERDK